MKNILWIDDEPEYLLNYRADLEKGLDCNVSFAQDIIVSIKKINENNINLIILDLLLPFRSRRVDKLLAQLLEKYNDYTGIALIEILKMRNDKYFKNKSTQDIPIIICSSFDPDLLIESYPVLKNDRISFFKKENLTEITQLIDSINILINQDKKNIPLNKIAPTKNQNIKLDKNSVLDYYQKVRHDFLNHYNSLNSVFSDTIKYFTLTHNSINLANEKSQAQKDLTIRNEIKKLLPLLTDFLKKYSKANDIVLVKEILDNIDIHINKLQIYITKNDSLQFYQIKDIICQLYSDVENLRGKLNKTNKRLLIKSIDNLLSYFFVQNIYDAKDLIKENLIKTTSDHYTLNSDSSLFDLKQINIIELLTTSINDCKLVADYQKVIVNSKYNKAENIQISGHKFTLSKAIKHILLNAIKYTERIRNEKQDPWIDIRIKKDSLNVSILIENWGVIIPKEELESRMIVNKNYRGNVASSKRAGLGLGLYEADEIIKIHGGTISYFSELQVSKKGLTTFKIELPILK